MKKLRFCAAVLALIAAALTGCGLFQVKNNQSAQALLKEKYGESFIAIEDNVQTAFDGYYTVHAYPVKRPGITFTAHIDNNGKHFSDNYVERCVAWKISDCISKNMSSLSVKPCIYTVVPAGVLNEKNQDISIEDYISKNKKNLVTVHITICRGTDPPETVYGHIANAVQELDCLQGLIVVNVADEKTLDSIHSYCSGTDSLGYGYDELRDKCLSFDMRYSEGKLSCSREQFSDILRDAGKD